MRLGVLNVLIIKKITFLGGLRGGVVRQISSKVGEEYTLYNSEVGDTKFLKTSVRIYPTIRRHITEQRSLQCHIDCNCAHCNCVVNVYF